MEKRRSQMIMRVLSFRCFVAGCLACCFAAMCLAKFAPAAGAGESATDAIRNQLTAAELMTAQDVGESPVQNAWFMPVGEPGPAHHRFEGTLSISEFELRAAVAATTQKAPNLLPGQALFPGVDLQFFEHDGYLVPVRRDAVRPVGFGRSPVTMDYRVPPFPSFSSTIIPTTVITALERFCSTTVGFRRYAYKSLRKPRLGPSTICGVKRRRLTARTRSRIAPA